jgi:hypothetical protein
MNDIRNNVFPENWGVGFEVDPTNIDYLNVPGIDFKFISTSYKNFLLLNIAIKPQVILSFAKTFKLNVEIYNGDDIIKKYSGIWNIDEQTILQLLFNLLYHKVRLYDVHYMSLV